VYDPNANTLTDLRDGNVYKTKKFGDQVWMVQNLNYDYGSGLQTSGNDKISVCGAGYDGSWCSADCDTYGRFYTLAAVKDSLKEGICPDGWHVPDTTEWNTFLRYVNASENGGGTYVYNTYSGLQYKLLATTGWKNAGTDDFDFSFNTGCNGGTRASGDYAYYGGGSRGAIWTSTQRNGDSYRNIEVMFVQDPCTALKNETFGNCSDLTVYLDQGSGDTGAAIRCVKD
jgi:uncharacterized protein (TIGR02145 family)